MLTTLKIALLETSKEQLSINLIVCKNNLMGAEDSDAGSPERQSKYWAQEDPDASPSGRRKRRQSGRQSKYWTQEHREGLPRKLQQEHRDGLPRKLQQEDHDGWPRKFDGWPRKLA